MRKYKKQQILDLITTIHSAHIEIKKLIEKSNYYEANDLIIQSQEAAISIGYAIEDSEGEGLDVITYIEEYCEYLYKLSNSLTSISKPNKEYKKLKQLMLRIEESVEQDIVVELEIVFLPYKASMWDSLESIWMAAKNDENCESFVIPIPYFDRSSNGEFTKMHYEANEFPDYVPITHYLDYDFADRKPDIIYFHNPYDQHNLVSSVHPDFYSSELKKHTEMLVYVPYFVWLDNLKEHFCGTMGVVNANKVIVQSEEIRKIYLRYAHKDKIVALGSPKLDKIIHYSKDGMDIPNEWKDLIEGKKIVLYNTSLASLLEHGEDFIDKLKFVFSFFEGQKNCVLLWRPHPLSVETIRSMRPQLLDKYLSLENQYRENKIGIFDDTADFHRAITLSDAYLGDSSSLLPIYGATGKPIMLQDIRIKEMANDEEKTLVWFEDLVVEDNIIWFTAGGFNGLFKMDLTTNNVTYLGKIPNEKINGRRLYSSLTKVNNKIILAPLAAEEIAEYDVETCEFKKVKLQKKEFTHKNFKFSNTVKHKEYVVLIGCDYPAIVRYNSKTNTYDYFDEWTKQIKYYQTDEKDFWFRESACIRGDNLLIPCCQNNIVMEFNIESGKSKLHSVGSNKNKYASIAFDGRNYWLTPRRHGAITRWNYETGEVKEYDNYPDGFERKEGADFTTIVFDGRDIILISSNCNMNIKVDINTGHMEGFFPLDSGCEKKPQYVKPFTNYYFAKSYQSNIITMDAYDGALKIWNRETNQLKEYKVFSKEAYDNRVFSNILKDLNDGCFTKGIRDFMIREYESINGISGLIDTLVDNKEENLISKEQSELFKKLFANSDGRCGEKIHEFIKKEIM